MHVKTTRKATRKPQHHQGAAESSQPAAVDIRVSLDLMGRWTGWGWERWVTGVRDWKGEGKKTSNWDQRQASRCSLNYETKRRYTEGNQWKNEKLRDCNIDFSLNTDIDLHVRLPKEQKKENSHYFIKHVIPDMTVNPSEGKVMHNIQQRHPPPLFLYSKTVCLSGNVPPCCGERFADLSISQTTKHWRLDFL